MTFAIHAQSSRRDSLSLYAGTTIEMSIARQKGLSGQIFLERIAESTVP